MDDSKIPYEIGTGLKVQNGKLMVDSTDTATENNPLPITSQGVAAEVGNLDALLSTV